MKPLNRRGWWRRGEWVPLDNSSKVSPPLPAIPLKRQSVEVMAEPPLIGFIPPLLPMETPHLSNRPGIPHGLGRHPVIVPGITHCMLLPLLPSHLLHPSPAGDEAPDPSILPSRGHQRFHDRGGGKHRASRRRGHNDRRAGGNID